VEQINNSTEKAQYLHHDQAGSTRLITGSAGTVEGKCSYGAYGTPTCEGSATTPLGYDGQYTNSDTGLIYLRNRVYDPTTAQFLSVDPLDMVTRAPYNYAEDNPINDSDPTGLSNWNPFNESFWTEGNVISESPLNPIPYFEKEIESYEDGCGYFASVTHGLEGTLAGAALFAGGEGVDEADITVSDVLEGKLGSITRAPLPPGSPA
jgi:RHS repeat-associated protein